MKLLIALLIALPVWGQFGNATKLQSRPLTATAPVDTNVICWDGSASSWKPCATGGTTNQKIRTIGASFGTFESGATVLSASKTVCVPVRFAGTIQSVEIIGDVSGSAIIDVLTILHASWTGRASASSITAAAIPALTASAKFSDSTLAGWTTTLAADTDVCFAMTSPSSVAGVSITLKVAAN